MTKIIDIKVGEVKPLISPEEAKDSFAALIESYKIQNPAKYELKKEALATELDKLEAKCQKRKTK